MITLSKDSLKTVLKKHHANLADTFHAAKELVRINKDRLKEACEPFDTQEDQEAAILSEMENILIEEDVLEEPKQFDPPETAAFLDSLTEELIEEEELKKLIEEEPYPDEDE